MAHVYRFNSYPITEQKQKEDDTFVKNTAEYYGDAGLYKLVWYPDAKTFRLVFPDSTYLWDPYHVLNTIDELNPYSVYEDGKILIWMRHAIMSDEYKRTSMVSDYVLENLSTVEDTAIKMQRFNYISEEGLGVTFDISEQGLVVINIPSRRISGSPDELFNQMPELGYLWGGDLIDKIKVNFQNVTGMPFGE